MGLLQQFNAFQLKLLSELSLSKDFLTHLILVWILLEMAEKYWLETKDFLRLKTLKQEQ